MGQPKPVKVYVRRAEQIYGFMWANVAKDGSVMLGFTFPGTGQVELVLDEELGQLRHPKVITKENVGQAKISFHASGHYRLTATMGKTADAVDRATVKGPRLDQISEPRRMVELLLPKALPKSSRAPGELDIVLDATSAPDMPLRCTISCMSKEHLEKILNGGGKFVDTSIWEFVHALQSQTHVWVWTLRASKNDETYPDRVGIFLIGPVKWGNAPAVDLKEVAESLYEMETWGRLGAGAAWRLSTAVIASKLLNTEQKEQILARIDEAYPPFGRFDLRPIRTIEDVLMQFDEFKSAWVTVKFERALVG